MKKIVQIISLVILCGSISQLFCAAPQDIFQASESGNVDRVRTLLRSGIDVNAQNEHRETALIGAVSHGQKDIVKMLLEAGANANAQNESENTVLTMAVYNNQEDIVEMLLKACANANAQNKSADSALINAVELNYINIVEMLLEAGADVNDHPVLIIAAEQGNIDIVKMLLAAGADKEIKNEHDETAEQIARANDHTEIADFIRDYRFGKLTKGAGRLGQSLRGHSDAGASAGLPFNDDGNASAAAAASSSGVDTPSQPEDQEQGPAGRMRSQPKDKKDRLTLSDFLRKPDNS